MIKATTLSALIFFAASGAACATSRLGQAEVRDDGGVPCFTITKEEAHRAGMPNLSALTVDDTAGKPVNRVWSFILKPAARPLQIAPDACIRYGSAPDAAEAVKTAEPLQPGRIYTVFLNARPADDTDPTFGYEAAFCLYAQPDGTRKVHKIAEGASRHPESCKP